MTILLHYYLRFIFFEEDSLLVYVISLNENIDYRSSTIFFTQTLIPMVYTNRKIKRSRVLSAPVENRLLGANSPVSHRSRTGRDIAKSLSGPERPFKRVLRVEKPEKYRERERNGENCK